MIYGYARVSTKEQKLDRQYDSLEKYVNKNHIYSDKQSGKDTNRPQYQKLKSILKENDVVYIHALDRLSRRKEDIVKELAWFKSKGVTVRIENVPTTMIDLDGQEWITDMINNIVIELLGSIAEQERLTLLERQKEGIEAAKKRGQKFGRDGLDMSKVESVKAMIKQGVNVSKACKQVGIGRSTFYKYA